MKIAHFINPWLPVTQNWIYNQIRFNSSCEHVILSRTLSNLNQFPVNNLYAAYPENGVPAALGMFFARLTARYPVGFYESVVKKEQPDCFHGHFAWESWRNINLIRKLKLPLVTTFYGLDVNKHPQKKHWRDRYAILFDIGDRFTVEGPFMAESLAKLGCPRDKIRIIHLGVDIDHLQALRKEPASELYNIMFIGLEREKKGAIYAAEAFVRAARSHDHIRLHLLGDGIYRQRVKEIINSAGVSEKVIFHGYVSVKRYHELLVQMNCVLAPSVTAGDGDTEGGAPVSVIEAQAIGIPVIGSTHCDIPEIVLNQKTGLLSPERDVASLADNLITLIANEQLQKTFGTAAIEHIRNQHDIAKQVRKLTDVYREVT
ncbi:MAG TPA: glycosyltransferase [Chitinispirillaceae bacterium]|nr:glycosyltransferase [Chitinispirillaceae bacterium]